MEFWRFSAICQVLDLVKPGKCRWTECFGKCRKRCLISFPGGDTTSVDWLAHLFRTRGADRTLVLVKFKAGRFKIKPDVIQQTTRHAFVVAHILLILHT